MRHFLSTLSALFIPFAFLLVPGLALGDHHNETVIVVSTRLALEATVEPITLTVNKVYKDGEDEIRRVDRREVPPGRDLTSWVNHVTEQMRNAGFVRRPPAEGEEADENVIVYVREAPVIARFTANITINGDGTVTEGIDVALDLEKPTWLSVQQNTRFRFAPSVSEARQHEIILNYKSWISGVLDRFIADNEGRPVVLDTLKKEQLRQPGRARVSQSRPAPVEGGSDATVNVTVVSRLINRRLGVN